MIASADEDHRPGGGAHRHAQAGDDVGAVAGGRGLRDVLHRLVLRAGVVLGDPHQRGGQHQAHRAGAEQPHVRARAERVGRHHRGGDEVEGDQRQHAGDARPLYSAGITFFIPGLALTK
jgi:hypothetical protein